MKASNLSDSDWLRRRWLDFRNGHSVYLAFMLSFGTFVVITYTQTVERVELLKLVFPSMWIWGIFFLATYAPAAVIIGHFHRKFQIPTETRQMMDANPFIHYAQPGREKMLGLPVAILGMKAQIQSMAMQNAMADAIEKLAKETGAAVPVIPRFDTSFFKEYERAIYITERLTLGDNLLDIIKSLEAVPQKKNENGVDQPSNATK